MELISSKEESVEEITKRYRKMNFGYIAKIYSKEQEQEIYTKIANMLINKYGDIIEFDEIIELLSKRGHIYTMYIKKSLDGFYEYKTGNIGISVFLDRITEVLLHEAIHKIGFERKDNSFKEMSPVFYEAGTDIVTAQTLSDNLKRDFIFHNVWARFPEKMSGNFLNVCLVNQLNQAVGENSLEKSILKGKDLFKESIIKKYGEGVYVFLKENLEDLSRKEKNYWLNFSFLSDEEKREKEAYLKDKIYIIQNVILEAEFDRRIQEVNSLDEARRLLLDLNNFGLNRIREKKETDDGTTIFVDNGFDKYFENYKNILEEKYGEIDVTYEQDYWREVSPEIEEQPEITEEERRAILELSIDFSKMHIKKSKIVNFLNTLFGARKRLDNKTPKRESVFENYKLDNRNSNLLEGTSKGEKKEKRKLEQFEEEKS